MAANNEHTAPDPTFYRTPRDAAAAPEETLAYLAAFNRSGSERPDALVVVDVDSSSTTYSTIVAFDEKFFLSDFRGLRSHQVRLQGGDTSSNSYCFSSALAASLRRSGHLRGLRPEAPQAASGDGRYCRCVL